MDISRLGFEAFLPRNKLFEGRNAGVSPVVQSGLITGCLTQKKVKKSGL